MPTVIRSARAVSRLICSSAVAVSSLKASEGSAPTARAAKATPTASRIALKGSGGRLSDEELAETFARFLFLAFEFHARFFVVLALFHLLQKPLFDELLLEDPEGLIDLIIADDDFHERARSSVTPRKTTAQLTGSARRMSRAFLSGTRESRGRGGTRRRTRAPARRRP